ncbi:pentapeptide repeat-containing protein [Nonomuraea sediminis]|uniref:pentapeptide repeat-containing protein n=1 Tax=Nonomuraea sediminis TaxID=2835864 RepID=UPI0035569C46
MAPNPLPHPASPDPTHLRGAHLSGALLSGAHLSDARLPGIRLPQIRPPVSHATSDAHIPPTAPPRHPPAEVAPSRPHRPNGHVHDTARLDRTPPPRLWTPTPTGTPTTAVTASTHA